MIKVWQTELVSFLKWLRKKTKGITKGTNPEKHHARQTRRQRHKRAAHKGSRGNLQHRTPDQFRNRPGGQNGGGHQRVISGYQRVISGYGMNRRTERRHGQRLLRHQGGPRKEHHLGGGRMETEYPEKSSKRNPRPQDTEK